MTFAHDLPEIPAWLPPRPTDESDRLGAVAIYEALGTDPDAGFDRITDLVSRLLDVPVAFVSLAGEERLLLRSCVGFPGVDALRREDALCAYTILQDEPVLVPDTTKDSRFAGNPFVAGEAGIRFYLGIPLRAPSGHNVGTMCAIDFRPREMDEDKVRTARAIAQIAMDEFELRRALRESENRQFLLERTESRYRDLAESLQGMAFHAVQCGPREFHYEYASVGALDLFGLLPEQIVGRPGALRDLVHPDDVDVLYRSFAEAALHGRAFHFEGRAIVEGIEKWIRILARSETRPDEARVWRGVMVDVSEARQREIALAEARGRAERAVRAKGEFLSRVSHELRTPLNAILGFAQTLELEELGPDARADLAEIEAAGRHLLVQINDLLETAARERTEEVTEAAVVVVTEVDACELLCEVYRLLRPLFEEREITLRAVHRCDDTRVLADAGRMRQAIINVVTNAIKYNRPGGSVRVRTRAEGDGWIAVSVADDGPGIPPERLERLFTPFDRLGAEATGVQGTGLGLAITRGFVVAMGGRIDVASEVGLGSTFTLRFPVAPAAEAAA